MGQNSSRLRRPQNDAATQTTMTTHAVAGPSTDTQSDHTAVPVENAGPQRASVRRSILNLVKPRSRVSSAATHPENARRSWRRWSKAPPLDFNAQLPASSSTDLSSTPTAGPSTPRSENGKQPERPEADGESMEERGWPDDSGEAPSGSTLTAAEEEEIGEGEEVVIAPEEIESPSEAEPATTTTTTPDDPPPPPTSPTTAQQATTPTRQQFPPPGTLVVVQGIVHTTDVSRTPTQPADSNNNLALPPANPTNSTNPERSSSRARNRLSALLRPSATSSGPNDSPTPSTPQSSSSVDTALTTPDVNEPADSSASAPRPATTTDSDLDRVPTISSSSIDVLGTLLSVAAAATAASLLTGSSEPILSSGLAPPGTAPTNSSNSPPNHSSRPTSPTPDGALGLGLGSDTRAERMRQAWGTIRERLGLRPNPPSTTAPSTPAVEGAPAAAGDQPPTPAVPTDTRELMLAEMARAFNVGLGLNGLGGVVPGAGGDSEASANSTASGDAQEPAPLPAEGSFERFLFDLQADLRNALTHADGLASQDNNEEDDEEEDEGTRSNRSSNDEHREMPPLIPVASTSLESVVRTTASGSRFLSGDGESSTNPIPAAVSGESIRLTSDTPRELGDDDDDGGMPDLQDVSDTESESDDDEETDEEADVYPPQNPASTSNTEQLPATVSPSMGSGRIDAEGRINWWRLYRFPPIVSPRAVAVAAAADAAGSRHPYSTAGSGPDSNQDTQQPSSPPTTDTSIRSPSINSNSDTTSSSTSSQENTQQPNNIVVPVIVVGLQSVNAPWRPDGLPSDHDGHVHEHDGHTHGTTPRGGMDTAEPPAASGSSEPESPDDDDFDGFGNQNNPQPQHPSPNTTGSPRENRRSRGWQSRAAAAIRNLRPGNSRRNSSNGGGEGQQPAIGGPGSRTFLIYVIGGYYPPDHSIVTGGPNNMESFEALLELADLLGQTKPPTASKEEIDNSGLEIIKPAQLVAREKDGRVASNCIERCLICLDEYEPEEDVRVMTCRHAFHKNCVDKWLQTGRNNCPACRTLGVSTEGSPIHTPPVTPGA